MAALVPRHCWQSPKEHRGGDADLEFTSMMLLWQMSSSPNHPLLPLTLEHVATIGDNEITSQPCLAIYHTHRVTLGMSSCSGEGASIQTHSTLVWKVADVIKPKSSPPSTNT
eukprot:scaffold367249_cov324-Cyclotella_meneghiniana.AAC.1